MTNISLANDSKEHAHASNEKESKSNDHDDHDDGGSEHEDEGHDHKEEEKSHESVGHGHGGEGGEHGEEENAQVGPDKGITEYDEEKGFKLSSEALKNFDIKTMQVVSSELFTVDSNVVVHVGQEKNLFRLRDGFFKRIDYSQISKNGSKITMRSKDLKSGDQIVIQGLGFLRISEIAATGGAPEGHSH